MNNVKHEVFGEMVNSLGIKVRDYDDKVPKFKKARFALYEELFDILNRQVLLKVLYKLDGNNFS